MNIKEKLQCTYCNEIYKHPITLICCGENICKQHVKELSSNLSNKFMCPLCNEENCNQNLNVNKLIQSLLEIELHEFELDPKYQKTLHNLQTEIGNFEILLKEPKNYISEQINELKRQVDLDREIVKSEVDELANDLIQQLESYGKKFKAEYKSNIKKGNLNILVESSRKQLTEYQKCLTLFSTKNQDKDEKYNLCEKIIKILHSKIKLLKEKLFSNLTLAYIPVETKKETLFGKLITTENKKLTKQFFGTVRKTLTKHSKPVYALAILKNGDLISGSSDTVKIWDVNNWNVKQTFNGHADLLRDILVVDENTFINASEDFSINIRSLSDGSAKNQLRGHTNSIRSLVLLGNDHLASGSVDKTIKIWNVENGILKTLKGHTDQVGALVLLDNGDLVSGSSDATIKIWDVDNEVVKRTLKGHSGCINVLTLLANGGLVSGSSDNTIKIWNLEEEDVKRTLIGHTHYVNALKALDSGDLASGSSDGTIKIWDVEDGTIINDIKVNSRINSFGQLVNGDLISACDKSIIIWE